MIISMISYLSFNLISLYLRALSLKTLLPVLISFNSFTQNANNVNEIFLAIARKLPRDSDGAGAGGAGSDGGRRLTAGQNGAQEGNKSCCNRQQHILFPQSYLSFQNIFFTQNIRKELLLTKIIIGKMVFGCTQDIDYKTNVDFNSNNDIIIKFSLQSSV